MNFEEVPVDNYTGQPDISVPLFDKPLNSELTLAAVIKYSPMGVRVEQRSGWVGTGWSLEVGGVVSRTIRGIPDELEASGFYDNKIGLFHLPAFWNWDGTSAMEQNTFIWNVNGSPTAIHDSEPDLYQFNVLGISGRFVVVLDGGQLVAKQLSLDQKLKITVGSNANKTITGFTIIDANGYKYKFGYSSSAIETSVTEDHTIVRPRDPGDIAAPIETTGLPASNTAWHLTSVENSNSIHLADFYYTNSEEYYSTSVSRTNYEIVNPSMYSIRLASSYNLGKFKPEWTSNSSEVTTQTKKLSKIVFRDKTRLKFIHSSENSHPENDGIRLDAIQMIARDTLTVVRQYSMSYVTTPENSRLWLTKVNGGMGHIYDLEYYEKDELPGVESTDIDAWGYSDGDFRHDITKGYNYYDYNAIKRGLLTKITYPTEGTKDFTWGPHTFTYEGNVEIDNYDKNPLNSATQDWSHQFTATTNNMGTQSGSQAIVISHDQYIQVQKNIQSGGFYANIMEVKLTHATNPNYSIYIGLNELSKMVSIRKGTYNVTVRVKFLETLLDQFTVTGYINIKYQQKALGDNYNYYLLGGGPRINKIEFKDPDNTANPVQTIVNFDYSSTAEIDPLNNGEEFISSGSIDSKLGSMYREYTMTDRKYLYNNGDEQSMSPINISYNVTTSSPNLQLTKGNYVGYKKVRATEGIALNGTNSSGSTVYTYTSPQDFPSPSNVFIYPYVNNTNLDHKRGLLLSTTIYDKNSVKQEEIVNTYTYDAREQLVVKGFTLQEQLCEWTQFYTTYDDYHNESPTFIPMCGYVSCIWDFQNCSSSVAPFIVHWTDVKSTAAELTSTVSTSYLDGTAVASTTSYTYNPDNYQIASQTETYDEGGSTITHLTEYQYPFTTSYTASYFNNDGNDAIAEMANMVNLNMVNKPVTVTTSRNGTVLSRVITKYDTFATNQILPKEIETLKGTRPAEDRVIFSRYNLIGNPEEVRAANGIYTSYIWGYEGTLPIAKVENAQYTAIPNAATLITTSNTGTESTLRADLNTMRSAAAMANCMVTTLTYDPCKGVLTTTDPRAIRQTYEYEASPGWRLRAVKDNVGKLLSEYFYNFRDGL